MAISSDNFAYANGYFAYKASVWILFGQAILHGHLGLGGSTTSVPRKTFWTAMARFFLQAGRHYCCLVNNISC